MLKKSIQVMMVLMLMQFVVVKGMKDERQDVMVAGVTRERTEKECAELRVLIGEMKIYMTSVSMPLEDFKTDDTFLNRHQWLVNYSIKKFVEAQKYSIEEFLESVQQHEARYQKLLEKEYPNLFSKMKTFLDQTFENPLGEGFEQQFAEKFLPYKILRDAFEKSEQEKQKLKNELYVLEGQRKCVENELQQKIKKLKNGKKVLKNQFRVSQDQNSNFQSYLGNVTLGCMAVTTGCLAGYAWAPNETAAQWSEWLGSRMVGASLISLAAYLKAPKNLPAHKAVKEAEEAVKKESSRWAGIFNNWKKIGIGLGLFSATFATLYKSDLIAEKLGSFGFGNVSLSGMSAMGKQQLSALLSGIRTRFSTPTV